tara:strand:- start:38 stop:316 length:279 start_codon:yes stop_codon:yes gene_type:complete
MTKNKKQAAKATQVTKEELQKVQTLVNNINNTQFRIGELELEKTSLVSMAINAKNQWMELQNKLRDKYGDVVVNINDGSLKPREDEQVNTKN